jgi:hypothetical protein
MKIQNDPLQPLPGLGEARGKPRADGRFDGLLARELLPEESAAGPAPLPGAGRDAAVLAMQIRAARELSAPEAEAAGTEQEQTLELVNGLLEKWELYAGAMNRAEGANLKNMHQLLGGLSGELDALKSALPGLTGENSGLGGILNELDVLTAAERVKFDRGDYL